MRRSQLRIAIGAAIAMLVGAVNVHGQGKAVQVKHAISCPQCRIELSKLQAIEPSDDLLLGSTFDLVAVTSRREFIIGTYDRLQLAVFSATGKLTTVIGKRGQGPGEIPSPIRRLLVGPGDTVFAFTVRDMHVFSPQFAFVRSAAIPAAGAMEVLSGSRVLLGDDISSRNSVGHPYHILGPDGKVVQSFGYDGSPIVGSHRGPTPIRLYATPNRKAAWSGSGTRYRLVSWSDSGALLDSIEVVDAPWMKERIPRLATLPSIKTGFNPGAVYPAPDSLTIQVVGVDAEGLVWIDIAKPTGVDVKARRYLYEHRMEVFDPRTRTVVASQIVANTVRVFSGTNVGVSGTVDDDGVTHWQFWRVRVIR